MSFPLVRPSYTLVPCPFPCFRFGRERLVPWNRSILCPSATSVILFLPVELAMAMQATVAAVSHDGNSTRFIVSGRLYVCVCRLAHLPVSAAPRWLAMNSDFVYSLRLWHIAPLFHRRRQQSVLRLPAVTVARRAHTGISITNRLCSNGGSQLIPTGIPKAW